MIQRLLIDREASGEFSWINKDHTVDIMYKVALISGDNPHFQKNLLKFLLTHCDKQKDLYYKVCQKLIGSFKKKQLS